MEERKAKILLYDLEVSPLRAWTYGMWQANVVKLEDRQRLMSVSWQWYGEKQIHCETLYMQDTYNVDKHNDYLLVKKLHQLMTEADICIAHNGKNFDDRISNMLFIANGFEPVAPYKSVDTKQVAKRYFRFPSNSLQQLAEFFGIAGKTDVKHSDIWYECFELGSKKHWKLMEKYNNQDVKVLRQIYEKLRPFITNHPNINRLENETEGCPKCGSENLQSRGYRVTNVSKFRRYQCQNCGGWCSRRIAIDKDSDIKPSFVNFNA